VVRVKDIIFDILTILFLVIGIWTMVYMTKVVGFHELFNMVKENFIVYELYC